MSTPRFITVSTWAKLAGITRAAAYARIKRGTLKPSPLCEVVLIDTEDYAPVRKWHRVEVQKTRPVQFIIIGLDIYARSDCGPTAGKIKIFGIK